MGVFAAVSPSADSAAEALLPQFTFREHLHHLSKRSHIKYLPSTSLVMIETLM